MKNDPKTEADDGLRQTQIRMSDAFKARIRAYQKRLQKETGLQVSFSAAVRSLIEKGLDGR